MTPNFAELPSPDLSHAEPDWRWQRAIELAGSTRPRAVQNEDPEVHVAVRYLRIQARGVAGQDIARLRFPALSEAHRLWLDAELRSQLMILAIANTPRDEIAQHLNVDPAVIVLAESLFFDVRDALRATTWIQAKVVTRLAEDGDRDLAAKVKTAFYGGPAVAKALCNAEVKVPKDEADRLLSQELLLHAKFTAAIEFPLTEEQSLEFQKLFIDYKLQMAKLKLRKQAFAHRCQEDVRRYELHKQRLALAAARQGVGISIHPEDTADSRSAQPSASAAQQGPCHSCQPAVKVAG